MAVVQAFNCRILYGRYAANSHTPWSYLLLLVFHHPLTLSFQAFYYFILFRHRRKRAEATYMPVKSVQA